MAERLWLLHYNLACVPGVLVEVEAGQQFSLPNALKLDLYLQLNQSTVKSGFVNVLTDLTTLRCTRLEEVVDGRRTVVRQVGQDWMELADGLIVRKQSTPIPVGSSVLIHNRGDGCPSLELISPPKQFHLSLCELCDLHYQYFPLENDKKIDIEVYPETVGQQRLRAEYLKLLKPYSKPFHLQVEELKEKYSSWRKSRGDGNCYYRAVGYCYLEHLCRREVSSRELREFYLQLYFQTGYFSLRRHDDGFDKYFICALLRLSELLQVKETLGVALEHLEYIYLQDEWFDRSILHILKLAGANYIQDHESSLRSFSARPLSEIVVEVLAEGLESEGLIYQAMADVLDIAIVHEMMIENQDRIFTQEFVSQKPGKKPIIPILLRPGHYDILYTIQCDIVDQYNFSDGSYRGFEVLDIGELEQMYRTVEG